MTTKAQQFRDVCKDRNGLKTLLTFKKSETHDIVAEVNDQGDLELRSTILEQFDIERFIKWLKDTYGAIL